MPKCCDDGTAINNFETRNGSSDTVVDKFVPRKSTLKPLTHDPSQRRDGSCVRGFTKCGCECWPCPVSERLAKQKFSHWSCPVGCGLMMHRPTGGHSNTAGDASTFSSYCV